VLNNQANAEPEAFERRAGIVADEGGWRVAALVSEAKKKGAAPEDRAPRKGRPKP
jgi:hypothetical protein